MKIKVWVETEVEKNISLDDIFEEMNVLPDSERRESILTAVNIACGVLIRISAECITEMDDKHREIILDALREQSERYIDAGKVGE